ncbi:MAG: hypothetical protein PHF60_03905 [Candidatus ainarchaeum sp.]|nr:hypothetical protein [Candidatus ainarchaeum sp.]
METGEPRGDRISVDILSVGPLFLELDYRWLYQETRKAPFYKHSPLASAMSG